MKLIDSIKKDFVTVTWVLMVVAIAMNAVMGQIVAVLHLPVYLDSIGTMLVAVLCGPWAGALTGTLSNLIWGALMNPDAIKWFPVALFIGFVTGWCAVFGLFKNLWKVMITGFLVAVTAALVSTPIQVLVGGITESGSSIITAFLLQTGRDLIPAVLSTTFLVEPFDKIATALLTYAIIQGLSKRYIARFPRAENVEVVEVNRTQQLVISVGVAIVLVLIYAYIVKQLLGL